MSHFSDNALEKIGRDLYNNVEKLRESDEMQDIWKGQSNEE